MVSARIFTAFTVPSADPKVPPKLYLESWMYRTHSSLDTDVDQQQGSVFDSDLPLSVIPVDDTETVFIFQGNHLPSKLVHVFQATKDSINHPGEYQIGTKISKVDDKVIIISIFPTHVGLLLLFVSSSNELLLQKCEGTSERCTKTVFAAL